MNQYPTLLRRLGIVVDFLLDPSKFPMNLTNKMNLEINVALPIPAPVTRKPVYNRTLVLLSPQEFEAYNDNQASPDAYTNKKGLLDLNTQHYELLQIDVDSAGLKLMNFARSLRLLSNPNFKTDPVTRFEKHVGTPTLSNGGLTLVKSNRAIVLGKRLSDSKKNNDMVETIAKTDPNPPPGTAPANPPTLYAEDIIRGYRFDIWDDYTGKWHSLFKRKAIYKFNSQPLVVVDCEEGTSVMAATTAAGPTIAPDIINLHEALMTWNGWSLAARPAGLAVKDDKNLDDKDLVSEAEKPVGFVLKQSSSHSQDRFQGLGMAESTG